MADQPDGAQRPSLRGGDGSMNAAFQQQHESPPIMGPLVPILNASGSSCVPFNAHANTAVVDLPCHSPEEMNFLVAQVVVIAEQEKKLPLLLHKHRMNMEKVITETSFNYSQLMSLIRAEMEKTTDTTVVEMLSLLQGEFNSLALLATHSEATLSKNFDDYKNILYAQFGKVMTLERANLHNALAVWRDRFQHDQLKALDQQVKISQEVANAKHDLITNLQQQVSKSSLRVGLVLVEKKEVEAKIHEHEQALADLRERNQQTVASIQHAKKSNAQMAQNVKRLQQQIRQLESKVCEVEDAHTKLQAAHQYCPTAAEVDMVFDELHTVFEALAAMEEKRDRIEAEHQLCAEYAVKVKNLPDIWELRTEVNHLKQENARLLKKNMDLNSERGRSNFESCLPSKTDIAKFRGMLLIKVARNLTLSILIADTQVADEFAGLALENGFAPGDVRSRIQSQKLQSRLADSAARNDELMRQLEDLRVKNVALEDTVKMMQATSSDQSFAYPSSEQPTQSEAVTQELSEAKDLIDILEDKNTDLEQELCEYKSNPLEESVERLQSQLEIYKKLLTKDRSGPREILDLLSGTQMQKLVRSGLHRHNPTRSFVSETYFLYSQLVKDRTEKEVQEDAVKPASHFAFDAAVNSGQPHMPDPSKPIKGEPDANGIIWDTDSDDSWSN